MTRAVSDDSLVILGARLAAEEASHGAALFGAGPVELTVGPVDQVLGRNVIAVLATEASMDGCLHLADLAGEHGALFMNATCTDDALRGDKCRISTFHVAPSNSMLSDAIDDARQHAGAPKPQGAVATAWDASLERFGADTLNNRFRARFTASMTGEAWCAWFAVKVLGEASLRARSVEARPIAAYLRGVTAQFDGHKGRPLSFRAWDNQLRQPLYVIATSGARRLIIESPLATHASVTSRDVLDQIGTKAASTTCRFAP